MLLLPKLPLAQTGRKGLAAAADCFALGGGHGGGMGFWLVGPDVWKVECGRGWAVRLPK